MSGKELADIKALLELPTDAVHKNTHHLLLLFEPGLYLVLAKTNKPVGQKLRRFIADEVLPKSPETEPISQNAPSKTENCIDKEPTPEMRRLALAEAREARLNRQLKSKGMWSLVNILRQHRKVSEDIILSYEIAATEAETGLTFSTLKPDTEDDWESPSEIAARLGVSAQRVGLTITELNLRGNHPGLSKAIVNKAQGHQRTVTSYLYSPQAVQRIEQCLSERPVFTALPQGKTKPEFN